MKEKIKVLHIIKSLGRGGAEMLLPESLGLHNQDQFEFYYLYFLPWKDQMVESIEQKGGKVTCFASKNNLSILLKIWRTIRFVKQNNIQLIHSHLPWAGILARIVGQIIKVPVIYTEHNKQERYHWITQKMNLCTMGMLTEVIAVSSDVAGSIHRNKPDLRVSVRTIANGVNVNKFRRDHFNKTEIRARLGIPNDAPIVGSVAVFRFQKRLDLWMELAAAILRDNESAHFVLVGDGPLRADLFEKREALGLGDRIHMPGLETEIRPYLASFDIYMMSSIFEGLPVAMLEAMAMQCPVITTDAGGIKEVIRHEVDGLVCSVEKPQRLVEFATMLLKKQNLLDSYGEHARRRVVEKFSMERMVMALEEVYHSLAIV